MRKQLSILLLLFSLAPTVGWAAGLSLSLARDAVGPGEGVQLSVRLEGGRAGAEPQIAGLETFRVSRAGRSSSTQIVGGRLSSATEFYYYLEPLRPGRYLIGPARLGNLVSNTLRLTVADSADSNAPAGPSAALREPLSLTASLNKVVGYEGERLEYVLTLATRLKVGDLNVSLPPQLDLRQEGEPRQYQRGDQTCFELRYSFRPKRPGRYRIAPAAMGLQAYVQTDPFFAAARPVSLRSQGLELVVRPLPASPADFVGLVGSYRVKASLAPARLKLGEAATYKLELSGAQPLPDLKPTSLPGLKLYADKPVEQGGRKTLSFAVVAERPGVYPITCAPQTFFDPSTGTYQRLSPPPLRLTVQGAASSATMLPPAAPPRADKRFAPSAPLGEDILPIHIYARPPQDGRLPLYGLLASLAIYLLLRFLKGFSFRPAVAAKPLKVLQRALMAQPSQAAALDALQAYFKAVLGLVPASGVELAAELARRGVTADLAGALAGRLESLSQAVYTGQGATAFDAALVGLIARLDKELACKG